MAEKWTTTRVEVVERDRWSGPTVLERKEFPTHAAAQQFCDQYNKKSCPPLKTGEQVPEYYTVANIVG